jgi:hypothetical protein
MPSTYTANNRIEKIGVGEQSGGTWGTTTNTNFDLFDTAIDGFVSVSLSGTTQTLNIPDAVAADGRNKVLSFTGSLSGANTVTVTPNTVEKWYFVQNNTTGGQNVIIAQGSGSTVTIKPGYSSIVYLDGAGTGAAVKEVLTSLKLTALLEATGTVFVGSGSGSTTLQAAAAASGTLTLPAATDTLVGRNTTDTLTNKSIPVVSGGTTASDTLTLRSTSGAGFTDAIIFQTGTQVEAARIDNARNFGIGRTAVYRLDVLSSTLITARIASTFASGGKTYSEMLFGSALANGGYEIGFAEDTGTPANGFFYLSPFGVAQGSSGIAINPAGRVGIGTSTPGSTLHVAGSTSFGALSANSTGSGYVSSITGSASKTSASDGTQLAIFSSDALASNPLMLTLGTVGNATAANRYAYFQVGEYGTGATPALVLQPSGGNVKIGGTALRATTEGSNQLVIFNGTAPVGTLANGCSFYSTAGEMRVMDAAGNATLLSPHDKTTNEWIYDSAHTPSGKRLKINVEKLLRFVNDHFGLDCVSEFMETAQ